MTHPRDYTAIAKALRGEGSRETRMQAVADILWQHFHDQGVSWVGFYIDHPQEPKDRRLSLGPHRDKPACSPLGLHGACGQALLSKQTLIVRDVAELGRDYIACDPRDRSEIVIPLADPQGVIWGVLDVDSHDVGAFAQADDTGLRALLGAAGLM